MKSFAAILAFASVSACLPAHETYEQHEIPEVVCEVEGGCPKWHDRAVKGAFDRFEFLWEERFGYQPNFPDEVHVVEPEKLQVPCYSWGGTSLANVIYVAGASVAEGASGKPLQLVATALNHELTHTALWARSGDLNVDHERGSGTWQQKHTDFVTQLWETRFVDVFNPDDKDNAP